MSEKKKLNYTKAIGELEQIINEIETESIDMDLLTERVKRAAYLIKFCRGNLRTTEEEVKKALSDIDEKQAEELSEERDDADAESF